MRSAPLLKFLRDESGATAVEYGFLAMLIALAIIGSVTMVGQKLNDPFNYVTNHIPNPS